MVNLEYFSCDDTFLHICIRVHNCDPYEISIQFLGNIYTCHKTHLNDNQVAFAHNHHLSYGRHRTSLSTFKIPLQDIEDNKENAKNLLFLNREGKVQPICINMRAGLSIYAQFRDLSVNRNIYVITKKKSLCFTNEKKFRRYYKKTIKNNQDLIDSPEKNIYFMEYEDVTNDNSWELFKKSVDNGRQDCFFITTENKLKKYQSTPYGPFMICINDKGNLKNVLRSFGIVFSWYLDALCQKIAPYIEALYPFMSCKSILVSHGISYDKDSYFLSPYCMGDIDAICCCSKQEENYFSYIGQKNIHITGYPRFDKWINTSEPQKPSKVIFSPTWHRNIKDISALLHSDYWQEILDICQVMESHRKYDKMDFFLHPAIPNGIEYFLKHKLVTMFPKLKINFVSMVDENLINDLMRQASILITNYSSIAYDFSYSGKLSIYYLSEQNAMEGHYQLREEFWDNHTSVIAKNAQQLSNILDDPLNIIPHNRIEEFFSYRDYDNTQRTLDFIENLKSCHNETN